MNMSPASLANRQIDVFLGTLSGVRDGRIDSIHDARVATRRLRELLPLAAAELGTSVRPVCDLVRSAGRALGTVREMDALMTVCDTLMNAQPSAAGPLASMRVQLVAERHRAARRLVKKLERLDFDALQDVTRAATRRVVMRDGRAWKAALTARVRQRAGRLGAAINHASGVYFPNRLHKVRIHLKKLRYLTEIAEQTRAWRPAHLRHDAERVQDVLGDLHDRQVLLDRFEARDTDPVLMSMLRADILQRHGLYLERRERLHQIVAACDRFATEQARWPGLLASSAAMALLLPAAGMIWSGQSAGARDDASLPDAGSVSTVPAGDTTRSH